jgi:predicted DCC family thiol-disulfide oxidoreductase YuxK
MSTATQAPTSPGTEPLTSERFPMLLFFDGECAFCNRWVARVKDADHARRIRYGVKQGTTFQRVVAAHPEVTRVDSVVLLTRRADGTEEVTVRSRAVRRVIAGLPPFWFFRLMLAIFPAFLADIGYRIFSKLRTPLFGKWSHCRRPIEADKELYVE